MLSSHKNVDGKMPLVYIVMPCYNAGDFLLEQLMSIYYQSYINRYLVFVDDGSTDFSGTIIRNFVSHYNLYDKVKIINKENGGVNSAINRAFQEIKKMCNNRYGDALVSYCDADDIWSRDKLLVQVNYMMNHSDCDLSYHDLVIIDENSAIISQSMLKNVYYKGESFFAIACFGVHFYSTMMVFRAKYIDMLYPLPLGYTIGQDLWTGMCFSILNLTIGYIDKQLAYYRNRQSSLSKVSNQEEGAKQRVQYIKLVGDRFKKDISYEYNYYYDRYVKWNGYLYPLIQILTFIKYPRVFYIFLKCVLYEKIVVKFRK